MHNRNKSGKRGHLRDDHIGQRKKPRLDFIPVPEENFPPPARSELAADFSQTTLLQGLQAYLAPDNLSLVALLPPPASTSVSEEGQPLSLPSTIDPLKGYCHGITLTWLRKMREHKANWFYFVKEAIVSKSVAELKEMEADVLKFLSLIQYAQFVDQYDFSLSYTNIDAILDAQMVASCKVKISKDDLIRFLEWHKQNENMIVISTTEGLDKHTIGIFVIGSVFCYFDANFTSGRPRYFCNAEGLLIDQIHHSFYTIFELPVPTTMNLYLGVANEPEYQSRLVDAVKEKPQSAWEHPSRFFTREKESKDDSDSFSFRHSGYR